MKRHACWMQYAWRLRDGCVTAINLCKPSRSRHAAVTQPSRSRHEAVTQPSRSRHALHSTCVTMALGDVSYLVYSHFIRPHTPSYQNKLFHTQFSPLLHTFRPKFKNFKCIEFPFTHPWDQNTPSHTHTSFRLRLYSIQTCNLVLTIHFLLHIFRRNMLTFYYPLHFFQPKHIIL